MIKVTREEAQKRVDNIGRDITILKWNGTQKTCTYRCNKCNKVETLKRGDYVYKENNRYYTWYECKCEYYKSVNQFYNIVKKEGIVIDEKINVAKDILKKYWRESIVGNELVDEVTNAIGIDKMTHKRFEFSILDRVCDYYKIKTPSFKDAYIIKEIYDEVLPKTKERIELEEKANREYYESIYA